MRREKEEGKIQLALDFVELRSCSVPPVGAVPWWCFGKESESSLVLTCLSSVEQGRRFRVELRGVERMKGNFVGSCVVELLCCHLFFFFCCVGFPCCCVVTALSSKLTFTPSPSGDMICF